MAYYDQNEWQEPWAWPEDHAYSSYPPPAQQVVTQVTTKIPPSFDGRTSWFNYDEATEDWCDLTDLDLEKQGPALKNRLEGEAAVYKPLLDRDLLREPADGVKYFINTLRPHFVKGAQSVFMWRFFQQIRSHRQNQDFLRWIGKLQVQRKRLQDAWMDLLIPATVADPTFRLQLTEHHAAQMQLGEALVDPDVALERWNRNLREQHRQLFPLSDNLYALIFIVLADLSEHQRERLTSTLTLRGFDVQTYTFDTVREVFMELFCMPKSALDNPNLRSGGSHRAFCILDQGELCEEYGYWAEDEETGEVGFLPELEDVFWVYQDHEWAWAVNRFQGRQVRRGAPKGKGKGKGHKGFNDFKPFRKKGKGKGKHANEVDYEHSGGPPDKGKKGKKGKGRGKGFETEAVAQSDTTAAPPETLQAAAQLACACPTTSAPDREAKNNWHVLLSRPQSGWTVDMVDIRKIQPSSSWTSAALSQWVPGRHWRHS